MKTWMYKAKKEELASFMRTLKLNTEGTLEELRNRMSLFIDEHPDDFTATPTYFNPAPAAVPPLIELNAPAVAAGNDTKIINQMRKWGCHFDGRDPIAFLERVEELGESYRYTREQLLRGLPELLKGDALLWYRNHRETWHNWEAFDRDFRTHFLPRRYQATLRREIAERRQKINETFAQYVTVMMTLMRRAGGFTYEEQLDRIYENMHPDYKLYIRISDVTSINDLQARASEYKDIERERRELRKFDKTTEKPAIVVAYTREDHCWRCKGRGHTRVNCKRPAKKFCSQCGRDGVLTSQCHPRAGNEKRAGNAPPASRPDDNAE